MTGGGTVDRHVRREDGREGCAPEEDVGFAGFRSRVGRSIAVDGGDDEIPLVIAIGIADPQRRTSVVTDVQSRERGIGRRRQTERRGQRTGAAAVDDVHRAGAGANGRRADGQIEDAVAGNVPRRQNMPDARAGDGEDAGVWNSEVACGDGSAVIVDDVDAPIAGSSGDDLAKAVVVQIGTFERRPQLVTGSADDPDHRIAGRQRRTIDRPGKEIDLPAPTRCSGSADDQIAGCRREGMRFLRRNEAGVGGRAEAITGIVAREEDVKIVQGEGVRTGHPAVEHAYIAS